MVLVLASGLALVLGNVHSARAGRHRHSLLHTKSRSLLPPVYVSTSLGRARAVVASPAPPLLQRPRRPLRVRRLRVSNAVEAGAARRAKAGGAMIVGRAPEAQVTG